MIIRPPASAQVFVVALMFVGRIGLRARPRLAIRNRGRRHQLPEEPSLVGQPQVLPVDERPEIVQRLAVSSVTK